MVAYDWIVIGSGITGAALAYELQKLGARVLLLDRYASPRNATHFSYGGLHAWAATDAISRQLASEGMLLHRQLSDDLGSDTQFRDLDLLLVITGDDDPQAWPARYAEFATAPELLDPAQARECEPLLDPGAIAGALRIRHGRVCPRALLQAYLKAFVRLGGKTAFGEAAELCKESEVVIGARTPTRTYRAANTVVCAGGLSRRLYRQIGFDLPIYSTRAELLEIPAAVGGPRLRTAIMPARNQRLELEALAIEFPWDAPPAANAWPAILDPGVVQFDDGRICLGQRSTLQPNPAAVGDRAKSETVLRQAIAPLLPAIAHLPGTWHQCSVAFSPQPLPPIGKIAPSLYAFAGFTGTMLFAPTLARRFAAWVGRVGSNDEAIDLLPLP